MHSISPYLLRCFNPMLAGKLDERYSVLDKVGQLDTFNILKDFLNSKSAAYEIIDELKQVYKFQDVTVSPETREIYGWLMAGTYGLKTQIINIETGKVDFEKAQNNSEIIPHYFHFFLPVGFNEGVAIFHSYRNHGVKTLFSDMFAPHFNEQTKLHLQMRPLSYDKALAAWQEASAKELRITKFNGLSDLADQLKGLGHQEQELTLKPPRKHSFGKLKDFFNKDSEQAKAVEVLSNLGHLVKSVVEINGKRRTFSVGMNDSNSVCQIDLDDGVKLAHGIPVLTSIHVWTRGIIHEYAESLYPGLDLDAA